MDYDLRTQNFALGYNGIMADGDDGIFSGISDVLGGELKKLGQAATHQVTGADPANQKSAADDTSALDQLKGFGKTLTSQVVGTNASSATTQKSSDDTPVDELKKFGGSFAKQLFGGAGSGGQEEQLAKMKKTDDDFSKQESGVIRAKIANIYKEYAQKRANEKKQEVVVEKQEEQQKQELKEVKKEEMTNRAIQQTRAEIKNYGAE